MTPSCDCNQINVPPIFLGQGLQQDLAPSGRSLAIAGDPLSDPALKGPDTPGTLFQKIISDDSRVSVALKTVSGDKKLALSLNLTETPGATQTIDGSVYLLTNDEAKVYYNATASGNAPKTIGGVVRYGVLQPNHTHWASNDDTDSASKDTYSKNPGGRIGHGTPTPTEKFHVSNGNIRIDETGGGAGGALILNKVTDLTNASGNWGDFPITAVWSYNDELYAKLEAGTRYKLTQGVVTGAGEFGLTPGAKVYIFVED